ncbi:unnamed protein product [Pleuronectes platessa]|uniref:Uncharacterized protein n=1 Tax=Pleuronectes platessa TaxID=8262 RepID=A0A9N7Y7X4_PLEPL|nr:unnamed protein product [Pleuronectes platessa]
MGGDAHVQIPFCRTTCRTWANVELLNHSGCKHGVRIVNTKTATVLGLRMKEELVERKGKLPFGPTTRHSRGQKWIILHR